MSLYPFDPAKSQTMQSDVPGASLTQAFIAVQRWTAPDAAAEDGTGLGDVETSNTGATAVGVSGITQPDFPRNVVINPSDQGTVADIAAGNITITGTNINDEAISEAIAVVENQAHDTLSTGAVAFKTITAISIPQQDGADAEFLFGYGDKLGLSYMADTHPVIAAYLGGTLESTAPTVVGDADEIEKNTVDLNSALNGTGNVEVYLVVKAD